MYLILLLIIIIVIICILSKYKTLKKKIHIPESPETFIIKVNTIDTKPKNKLTKLNKPTVRSDELMFEKSDIKYYIDRYNFNATNIVEPISVPIPQNTDLDVLLLNEYHNELFGNNTQNEPDYNIVNDMIADDLRNYERDQQEANTPTPILNRVLETGVDTQNVHDIGVNRYIRNIFRDIPIIYDSYGNVVKEIKEYIKNHDMENEKYTNIEFVLDKISKRNSTIHNLNGRELDILATIWDKAKSNDNIRDMLFTQILDTKKSDCDYIYCPTGFVNRISTALVVETPELYPKTNDAINSEMMQTASNIRTRLESDPVYMASTDDKQLGIFKTEFYKKIESDYEGILDKKQIDHMVNPWIDNL